MNTLSDAALQELLKSKSVAIFSDLILNPIFSAVELEILARLSEAGTPTATIACPGVLPWCFQNPRHSKVICRSCVSNQDRGHKIASVKTHQQLYIQAENINIIELEKRADEIIATRYSSSQLETLEYNDVLIGPGVSATLSFSLKQSDADLRTCEPLAKRIVLASMIIVEELPQILRESGVNTLLIGNGRLATSWSASRVAEKLGIRVFSYEHLSNGSLYLVDASPVHDLQTIREIVKSAQETFRQDQDVSAAESFFNSWRYPIKETNPEIAALTNNNVFLSDQRNGSLPEALNQNEKNIAIFTSSEWEFASLPGWKNPFGKSQSEILHAIVAHPDLDPKIKFWIRAHPNQANTENELLTRFSGMVDSRCVYIGPLEDIDSYSLVEACDVVLTFGSTIGIEATYWGRPSVLCGRADYEFLDCVYMPSDLEEVVKMLNSDLVPLPRESTLPYFLVREQKGIQAQFTKMQYPKFPLIRNRQSANYLSRFLNLLRGEAGRLIRKLNLLRSKYSS